MKKIIRVKEGRWVRCLIVTVFLVLQVLQLLHYAAVKQNYFVDELFSMGYAHSFTYDRKSNIYITDSEDWSYESWIPNRILKEQIETLPEDSLLHVSFPTAVRMLLTRRNYHGFLNIVMSVLSPGEVTKAPGIFLNIPFFVCIQVLLYRLCMRFSGNFTCSLFTLIMYGFSPAAVNMAGFIRFYCLSVLLFMAAVYLHEGIWRSDRAGGIMVRTVAAIFFLYMAMKNSELILVLGGTLIVFFGFALFLRGRYREGICYLLMSVPAGLFYACTRTSLMRIVLHPSEYIGKGWPVGDMTEALLGTPLPERLQQPIKYGGMYLEWLFGNVWIAAAFAAIAFILTGSSVIRFTGGDRPGNVTVPEAGTEQRADNKAVPEAGTERRAENTGVPEAGNLQGMSSDQPMHLRWTFFIVILAVTAVYLLFYWLVGFVPIPGALRYLYFIYPLIAFLLWMGLDALTKSGRCRKQILSLCAVLTIVGSVCGRMDPSLYLYLYPEDRAVIQEIRETGLQKVLVVCEEESLMIHCSYDCINIMTDDAWIYPVSEDHPHIDTASCPEKMYVWGLKNHDLSDRLEDLTVGGYVMQKIGSTHVSDVYVAEKKQSTGYDIKGEHHSYASEP